MQPWRYVREEREKFELKLKMRLNNFIIAGRKGKCSESLAFCLVYKRCRSVNSEQQPAWRHKWNLFSDYNCKSEEKGDWEKHRIFYSVLTNIKKLFSNSVTWIVWRADLHGAKLSYPQPKVANVTIFKARSTLRTSAEWWKDVFGIWTHLGYVGKI